MWALLKTLSETSRVEVVDCQPGDGLERSGSSLVMTSLSVFSRKSVRYINAGIRVANLISFSWICLRFDLYSFSSSESSFFSFGGDVLALLLLGCLDLLALVDDGLEDVAAERSEALDVHDGVPSPSGRP